MTEIAGESTTLIWLCQACRRPYKTLPPSPSACTCPSPVATLQPISETVVHAAPRPPVRAAGEQDRIQAQFARKGKRVTVTITGTVVDAWTVNGGDLSMIVQTDDGRRIGVRAERDVLGEPEAEQP